MAGDLFAPYVKQEDASYSDAPPISARLARNESYATLVWRKLRRSITGMLGLVLVALLLLVFIYI